MEEQSGVRKNGGAPAPRLLPGIPWRRLLLGLAVATGAFLLLFILGNVLPLLIYVGCLVFLPVGLWIGRGSRKPWLDGIIYGGLTALVVALILFLGSELGPLGLLAALFLALPQGFLGIWLGARAWPQREGAAAAPRSEPPAREP